MQRRRSLFSRRLTLALLAAIAATGALVRSQGGAGGQQGVVARPNGVTCRTEYVAMRDGVRLATDIYMPATPGRYPVVMQRTPYGLRLGHGCFNGISGGMAFWAENGYVGITQDSRGTFRSEGAFRPIVQEQADGYDAVEWAAGQPWSTGKVGLTGSSYYGVTQWQAALTSPPHLAAITPGQTATDYHDHWTYSNGVFDLWFAQSWLLSFFAPDEHRRQSIAKGVAPDQAMRAADEYRAQGREKIFTTWASQLPLSDFAEYRQLAPYYYEWLQHPNYDDYWAKVDVEAHWQNVTVPALVSGAWSDLFALGSVRGFLGMRAHGGSEIARRGTKLVMQPGGHGGHGLMDFGDAGNLPLRPLHLRFYDRYLKGIDNGVDREPPVQLYVQVPPDVGTRGSGFWISADAFPPSGTEKVRFNLRSGGRANTRRGDGVLDQKQPSAGPNDTFTYDPRQPVPSHGGGLCCVTLGGYFGSGAQDQSVLELRDDVLVYTSEPLSSDLAVVGPVQVRFWAASSARDTDFVIKLVDVHPSAFSHNIVDRIVRARFRQGSKSAPSLIQPGTPYEYTVDMGNTATIFKKGHRLRLDISSSSFPHFARNQNTGNDPANDAQVEVATQTILHAPERPAYLELSVARNITGAPNTPYPAVIDFLPDEPHAAAARANEVAPLR